MKILIANLGSTSFKFCLFDMNDERELARGVVQRIGQSRSSYWIQVDTNRIENEQSIADHAQALDICLQVLTDGNLKCLESTSDLDAIGFKAVHGGRKSGVQFVDDDLLDAMTEMEHVAPAHNPIYVSAMKNLAEKFSGISLIAAFETDFHQTIDRSANTYAIPHQWTNDFSIRKWGFHGASHRYVAQRVSELIENCERIISLHLGGSSSLCGIKKGRSVGTTMGMSPQTGLPQSNRVGDFDPFALPLIMKRTEKTLEQILEMLANESGLQGISGLNGDIRDLESAADQQNAQAQLALDIYVYETRRHFGGLLVQLGGVDCIAFAGGTGENGWRIREKICSGLTEFGIEIDVEKNRNASDESAIHASSSRTEIWIVPTNEEIIVARQTAAALKG